MKEFLDIRFQTTNQRRTKKLFNRWKKDLNVGFKESKSLNVFFIEINKLYSFVDGGFRK
jgi:hypothetical protein